MSGTHLDRVDRLQAWLRRLERAHAQVQALAVDAPVLDAGLDAPAQDLAARAAAVLAQARRAHAAERSIDEGAAEEREPNRIDRLFSGLPAPTLGARLRRARLERGLTQKDLAARVGVDWRQVQRWEDDGRRPRPAALARLAQALEVSTADLLGPTQ